MKQTLIDLWNRAPSLFKDYYEKSYQEEAVANRLKSCYSDIADSLDEKDKDKLKKLENCYGEMLSFESERSFAEGFSFATKLIFEALS